MTDDYDYPLSLTSQFRFCGNPFRLDFYTFCSFGCKYCFARNISGKKDFKISYAKFERVENLFKKAFDSQEETTNITIELLRHKVPIHVGGLADPFQIVEWKLKLNYKLIELSNKYQYPLIFSTKTDHLPDEYWQILDPKLHAFQISLIGVSDEYIRKYEDNTPLASNRLNFLKKLRDNGFWCSIRIQPIIDIKEVIKLCDLIDGVASYVTLEHIKVNIENPVSLDLFKNIMPKLKSNAKARDLELLTHEKIENISQIKKHLTKTKIGVGDNDLHWLSESRCCCGVDTIGENFNNYLKYNLTYFTTENQGKKIEEDESIWIPKSKVSSVVTQDVRIKNGTWEDYVHNYCGKHNGFMCYGCSMKKKTDGIIYNRNNGKKLRQVSIFNMEDFNE